MIFLEMVSTRATFLSLVGIASVKRALRDSASTFYAVSKESSVPWATTINTNFPIIATQRIIMFKLSVQIMLLVF